MNTEQFLNNSFGSEALVKITKEYDFQTVLDIGSGAGTHADFLESRGKKVTRLDFGKSVYFKKNPNQKIIQGNYLHQEFGEKFDLIWACHVLEHQININKFLKKIKLDLQENGILCITVPPLKHEIVGGHVSLWNAGLLMYNLVLAGFSCRHARIKSYGYNISIIIKNSSINIPTLDYDYGDINRLKEFFPENLQEGFDGNITRLNW